MYVIDKGMLPKTINQADAKGYVGERARWYCTGCRAWHTAEIKPGGILLCPDCGSEPEWKNHKPTLAYESRRKRVDALCAPDGDLQAEYESITEHYGDFIDATYRGMPRNAKCAGQRYFSRAWKRIDELAEYLLLADDSPNCDGIAAYDENGLRRKYYDPRRVEKQKSMQKKPQNGKKRKLPPVNIFSFSEVVRPDMVQRNDTVLDAVESMSLATKYYQPHNDDLSMSGLLDCISDETERAIARDFAFGCSKRDIERRYGLSEQRVKTIVSHIKRAISKEFVQYA